MALDDRSMDDFLEIRRTSAEIIAGVQMTRAAALRDEGRARREALRSARVTPTGREITGPPAM